MPVLTESSYSNELLLRPSMKSAEYIEKAIDILELLRVDLAHSREYDLFPVLVFPMKACVAFVAFCSVMLTEEPVVCELLFPKRGSVLPVCCGQSRFCGGDN